MTSSNLSKIVLREEKI